METPPTKEEPKTDPIKEELTHIKTEVETKLSSVDEKLDLLQGQLQEVLLKSLNPLPKEEPKEEEEDESWWGAFKQAPKKTMKETVAPLLNDFKEKAKAEMAVESNMKLEAAQYDAMAVQQYPQLKDRNSPLFKEYQNVLTEKQKKDPNWIKRPEAVFDTARIAFAQIVSKGEFVPEEYTDEARRQMSVSDATSPGYQSPGQTKPTTTLNKSQSTWASKLGVKPESYLRNVH